jgi:glycosyltransferase involved in cell wall biosynthesis
VVFCDRDWLSALSYAYSLADQDGGRMLAARSDWAQAQLGTGRLRPADAYVLFDLSPACSLARRADRLNRRHPWSQAAALSRLRDFYADPAAALAACPGLAARVKDAAWRRVCGLDPLPATLRSLRDLADPPRASGASGPCRWASGASGPCRWAGGPPAVVMCVHDGWHGCGAGAGASNRAFLETLAGQLPAQARLIVMPVWLTPDSPEHDPAWRRDMRAMLGARVDAQVRPVDNGASGRRRFAGLRAFQRVCGHAAHALAAEILPAAGPVLLLPIDVPFLGLPAHLRPFRPDLHVVLVPRSTAALHDPANTERIAWEQASLRAAVAAGTHVAAISRYMRHHLQAAYAVSPHALIDLPNGLTPADWRHPRAADTPFPPVAQDGFLLAMGRAVPYKGFDDLLDALVLLRHERVRAPHLLLAAVTDDPVLSAYQLRLARRVVRDRLDASLITRFSRDLRGLVAHPACRGVVVPSRAEPFGRIPLETYAAGGGPVIATTAGGLDEIVHDRLTGYTAAPSDPAALADALRRALTADEHELRRLRRAGRQLAATCHNYPRTVRRFLAGAAPWLDPTRPPAHQST